MRKPKLIEDYRLMAYDAVSPFAHSVVRQTSTSTFIKSGPNLVTLLVAALTMYDEDVAAFDHLAPAQTAYRDGLRTAVITQLNRLAKLLNLDYPGNEAALLSSGLTLMEHTGNSATGRPIAVETSIMDFDLLDASQPGCVVVKLKRPTGTIQNLLRYTTDPQLAEEHWLVAVGGGRERQLGPFPSGTKVLVKAAALAGSTVDPQYSGVKSRIVQ